MSVAVAPALIGAVHGASAVGEKVGLIVLALLAAAAVVRSGSRLSERMRALAMLGALVLTPALLLIDIWNTTPMRHLRGRPALAAALVVAGVLVLAALSVLFSRRRSAFPIAAVLTLPFRLPIGAGGGTADLLVPLYLVVAAGALAYLLPRLRSGAEDPSESAGPSAGGAADAAAADGATGSARARVPPGARAWPGALARLASPATLEWVLMGSVLLYAVQAAYSADFTKALQNVVFFYVPFALLLALLREVSWSRRLLAACGGVAVGLAVVFAGIGFVEWERKALFLNPQIVAASVYDSYFRVNSVFFDPNIYGRFLALCMLLLSTLVLWTRSRRDVLLAAAALAWLWAGLISSFSQSSMVALIAGLVVLAAWRWSVRYTIAAAAAALAAALILLFAAPSSLHFGTTGKGSSVNNATSGRVKLIDGGLRLFANRPIAGYGSGSFTVQYRSHESVSTASATSASHTTPVTIAAEQGLIGLIVYAALLLTSFLVLFAGAGRSPPRIAIAACYAALVVHTLAYADFLEDPFTWALLAIGMALAAAPAGAAAAERPARRGLRDVAPAAGSPLAPQ